MRYEEAQDNAIFRYKAGSHAYGTNTEGSDEDFRGVFIAPLRHAFDLFQTSFMGQGTIHDHLVAAISDIGAMALDAAKNRIDRALETDQGDLNFSVGTVSKPGADEEMHELRKFLKLAADNNPNIIEFLYVDRGITHASSEWYVFRKARDLFLSQKARATFSGYATAQLRRIKNHRGYLLNPPGERPVRKDFGLPDETTVPKENQGALLALPERFVDDGIRDLVRREKQFKAAMDDWRAYQRWSKERNEKRKEMERKCGYDCYVQDTEFLTETGWRKYEKIRDGEAVATMNPNSLALEFQCPTRRFEADYEGVIYSFAPQHMMCSVTPNHRMLVSPVGRQKSNNYSTRYDESHAKWGFRRAETICNGRQRYFYSRITCRPGIKEYPVSDEELILLGCYVSEGCIGKRDIKGHPTILRFSQKDGGRQIAYLNRILEVFPENTCRFESLREKGEKRKNDCLEVVYTHNDPALATKVANECLSGAKNKRLPAWTMKLSLRQCLLLLDVMVAGDGTNRKHSRVYYTSSKMLADSIQAMCIACGVICQVWGPYHSEGEWGVSETYQVYLGKIKETVIVCPRTTSTEWYKGKISCFSVPNEILVTRLNGKASIQGNSKHASHLVRLLRMALEIVRDGEVLVYRPDAAELLGIRQGKWEYDKLMESVEELNGQIDEAAKTSTLQKKANHKKIAELYLEVVESRYGIKVRTPGAGPGFSGVSG